MLVELYIFFVRQIPRSLNSLTSSCDKILFVTEMFCIMCVYNKQAQQGGGLITGQKLNVFVLNSWTWTTALENRPAKRVLRHPPSFTVQLGKQSTGVVCYLGVSTALSVFFVTAQKRAFLPWLSFSSAKLPTSGLEPARTSAYSVSRRAKLNTDMKLKTLTEPLSGAFVTNLPYCHEKLSTLNPHLELLIPIHVHKDLQIQ